VSLKATYTPILWNLKSNYSKSFVFSGKRDVTVTDIFTSFQIVPDRSRSFRTVPDRSGPFQIVPDRSRPFRPSITVTVTVSTVTVTVTHHLGYGRSRSRLKRSRWWTVETVWNGPERSGTKWKYRSRSRHENVTWPKDSL
jgi:hypothetical protein